ncbi:MAG: damage-inducible protein DinB [Terracidiphilus sp.]
MSLAITIEELLAWNDEASAWWKAHLEANPALLELPCGIGGAPTVQAFVRHIWGVELRWAQRVADLPATARESMPQGPLDALYDLHLQAVSIFRSQLADSSQDWSQTIAVDIPSLPPQARTPSRRKAFAHALLHSQRHWAQLSTLVRAAGFPSGFKGDLLFSQALE